MDVRKDIHFNEPLLFHDRENAKTAQMINFHRGMVGDAIIFI